MREIKFRVWDTEKKAMIYDGCMDQYDDGWESGCTHLKLGFDGDLEGLSESDGGKDGLWEHNVRINPDRLILMQYTGLHDKNGKEIYEGDIVSWLHRSEMGEGDNQDSMTVKWEEGEDDWGRYRMEGFRIPYVECEVIGNLFENHELVDK